MHQDFSVVLATLSVYVAVVVSPGPNFALISRLAVSGARGAAFGATVDLALAATCYAVLTMTGLALVLQRVGWLASLVQIAGGVYLVYLGLYAVMIPPGTLPWAKAAVLVGGFSIEVLWYGLVTLLMSSQPARAAYRRVGKWIERVIGTLLAGIGVRLIAEKV